MSEKELIYQCSICGSVLKTDSVDKVKNCPICKTNSYTLIGANEEAIIEAKMQIAHCYERILAILKKYIDTEEKNYKVIAIWIIGTYFHENFNTFPYLFFNAMRGSGKTRMLKLISSLGAGGDGSVQNNLTEAVLFRTPRGTTTCIDEFEQIGKKEKQTVRELLNSAYKKGMKVKRMRKSLTKEGEKQVVETFEPYFPIALANIWGMDEVLGDRTITLTLEKSNCPSIVKLIEDFQENPEIQSIKRTLELFSGVSGVTLRQERYRELWNDYICNHYLTPLTTLTNLTTLTPLTPLQLEKEDLFLKIDNSGISGRNLELFLPLILISKEINGIIDEFLKISVEFSEKKKEEEYNESKDVSLFEFISRMNESYQMEYITIKEFTSRFRDFLGEEPDEENWLNTKWVGKALKRLCLIIDKRKMAQGNQVTLNIVKAKEKLKMFKTKKEET